MKCMTSMERLSYQLNRLEGKLEAKRETTGKVLVWRFGQISQALQKQIGELSLAQLEALFDAALRFETKSELIAWLRQPPTIPASNSPASRVGKTPKGRKR